VGLIGWKYGSAFANPGSFNVVLLITTNTNTDLVDTSKGELVSNARGPCRVVSFSFPSLETQHGQ
jgi:hypothetical protein